MIEIRTHDLRLSQPPMPRLVNLKNPQHIMSEKLKNGPREKLFLDGF